MASIGPGEPGTVIRFDAALPVGVLGEVRIHQQVYARRPEVGAICRFISPQITALAALGRTPRPRHGFGSYFSPSVPFWPRPALVRDEASATGVAELLGDAPALVLNVNGAGTVGRTAEQAPALGWFLLPKLECDSSAAFGRMPKRIISSAAMVVISASCSAVGS